MALLTEPNILIEVCIIIIAATIGGFIARSLKQPLIPAYIIIGVLLGPVLGLIQDGENMWLLSEIGVAFLLFLVGLELDFRKLRDVGAVTSLGGVIQATLMFLAGYLASLALGFSSIVGIHLGLVLSFSSTMVVIKMLGDRQELDSLHSRIVIGILLVQDVIAILALSLLSDPAEGGVSGLALRLSIGALIIVTSYVVGKKFTPALFKKAAHNLELLFLVAVSACFAYSLLFAVFGFSIAIGAFIAGIILGNLPYHIEIMGRVRPLKDFFTVIFFTSIGLQVSFTNIISTIPALIIFLLLTLILSPILTMVVTILFGFKKRVAFLTGLALSQVSEFALIVAFAGQSHNLIPPEIYSLILELTIITIAISAYFIKYEEHIYKAMGGFLSAFERFGMRSKEFEHLKGDSQHDVVLIGLNRTGYSIFHKLKQMRKDFVVIDLNPDIIHRLIRKHVPCIYGDIGDPEVLQKLKLHQVNLVISTIHSHLDNVALLKRLKKDHSHARVIVTSFNPEDALELYESGADYVIIPHYLGGDHVSLMLEEFTTDIDRLILRKLDHIEELRSRNKLSKH